MINIEKDDPIFDQIKNDINSNNVVLYMKGTAKFPQCGFSGTVVAILNKMNIIFKDINILDDMKLRDAIKIYTDWPTIPQLYVKGKFIGGCDIVREMYETGELAGLFENI